MKAVYIDEELHKALKIRATRLGLPLRKLLEDYVRRALAFEPDSNLEVTTHEVTAAAAGGGSFDFWENEDEDIYLPTDGAPLE